MDEYGLAIHLTEPARRWLAKKGYDPQFGARPLRRAIQRHIENPLSIQLLQGDFSAGDLIVIDEGEGGLEFSRHTDQHSDFAAGPGASTADQRDPFAEPYRETNYYEAQYEDDDFADFLSQTDDDDEFDPFAAPSRRRRQDIDRLD